MEEGSTVRDESYEVGRNLNLIDQKFQNERVLDMNPNTAIYCVTLGKSLNPDKPQFSEL